MKIPVKELLKPVLYQINSLRQQDAEEDRYQVFSVLEYVDGKGIKGILMFYEEMNG